jgi:hypothetical protein
VWWLVVCSPWEHYCLLCVCQDLEAGWDRLPGEKVLQDIREKRGQERRLQEIQLQLELLGQGQEIIVSSKQPHTHTTVRTHTHTHIYIQSLIHTYDQSGPLTPQWEFHMHRYACTRTDTIHIVCRGIEKSLITAGKNVTGHWAISPRLCITLSKSLFYCTVPRIIGSCQNKGNTWANEKAVSTTINKTLNYGIVCGIMVSQPSNRVPDTCRIYSKVHWSCPGGSWCPTPY